MPLAHVKSHWLMLNLGLQTKDWREVAGQLPRIIAALLFSRIWVPVGNTGRARVSAFPSCRCLLIYRNCCEKLSATQWLFSPQP
ncbi:MULTISPECIES: DUF3703 domain-containing protein [unclassified Pseudomonas]|uniref:DUF3703 domain-containing protein n=1 Tax=unclassified Pseudomonas TaxID=196821 RepID=UPI002958BD9A|nr:MULTISPECIES: DUF3703 domain-containing protein [unclassified Pseudomonas]